MAKCITSIKQSTRLNSLAFPFIGRISRSTLDGVIMTPIRQWHLGYSKYTQYPMHGQYQPFHSSKIATESKPQYNQDHQKQDHREESTYEKYWNAWKNTKTEYYALPISIGITWIAVQHFMNIRRSLDANQTSEDKSHVEPTGPFWVHVYTCLPFRAISRAWGWMNNLTVPEYLRSPLFTLYSKAFGCNLDEMLEPDLNTYPNLAEFFYRELKAGTRPIAGPEKAMLVSPADGRILHFGPVDSNGCIEQVKGISYPVKALLGPSALFADSQSISPSKGNSFFQIVIYLAPGDYHRFHSPVDWTVSNVRHFAADLFSVSPKLAAKMGNLFAVNERVVMVGTWKYGSFFMIPVGATNVGSIRINMCPNLITNVPENQLALGMYDHKVDKSFITRGDEVGGFRLGSTVVLVFEAPSSFQFSVEAGQTIRVGQSLGR
ncbi:phosphatidylserine decarboxylase 1 [Batrachochytrium dendrobatidis]|nr:phosphatidylserine decarboxylase 1 [Batrachochytrium dendrobatidis]KAK5668375.1 phosphatidylserine decarboxylase 1 [Batrachochytrium dendrobatidis]